MDSQFRQELAPANGGEPKHPAVEIATQPRLLQGCAQHRGAERAGEVRATLAPVQARERKATVRLPCCRNVDAEPLERGMPQGRQVARLVGGGWGQPAERDASIKERHSKRPGDVIVAAARGAQRDRRRRLERPARCACDSAQRIKGGGHFRSIKRVITVASLREHLHQPALPEPLEVHARG